jgi:hypothetical protein
MAKSFRQLVRNKGVKSPTRPGFSLQDWHSSWKQVAKEDPNGASLFHAGVVVFNLLEKIRALLQSIMESAPSVRNEDLIMAYFALINRDRSILSKHARTAFPYQVDVFSGTLPSNSGLNELTYQEISDGSLDGLQLAISACIQRIKNGHLEISSPVPISEMEFISRESKLSQVYWAVEGYWNALLWNDFEFFVQDPKQEQYVFYQQPTKNEISVSFSHIRKQRLEAQFAGLASSPQLSKRFSNSNSFIFPSKEGKKKTLKFRSVSSATPDIIAANSAWKAREIYLVDDFPDNTLESVQKKGFSILEALDVYRCLSLLTIQLNYAFPVNDSVFHIKKLLQYCPRYSRHDLCHSTSHATGLSYPKVNAILSFFVFQGSPKEDLWCHPIAEVQGNKFALLTAALITPVMTRLVEHWLVSLGVDFQGKGFTYEATVLAAINTALRNNPIISDFDEAKSKRLKIADEEEEIDLIARIDSLILLCEIKSVVTTDSPISQFRSLEILEKASSQISRKDEFFSRNLEAIFGKMGWKYESGKKYKTVKFVINSGRMFIGSVVSGVPVVDEKIVAKYFESPKIPYTSTIDPNSGEAVHLAWFDLYSDLSQLIQNFEKYVYEPPHMEVSADRFEHKPSFLPLIDAASPTIIYNRLVLKEISPKERLERNTSFPIYSVADAEEKMIEMDVII